MPRYSKSRVTIQDIYTKLFDRIITGFYPGNFWLREDALGQEFSVSRSPIRGVLQQLGQDGMIELVPKRGARVYPFTADDIEDIYEIRKALESMALHVGMQHLSIQKLIEIKRQVIGLSASQESKEHARVDGILHTYLIESSKRRRLISMINELYRLSQSLRELGLRTDINRKDTIDEHCAILDALIVRNLEVADRLLSRHIENSKTRLLIDIEQNRPVASQ